MEWFRFYHEALDDPKVQRLPATLFKHWVNLLCLASRQADRGALPPVDEIAFALRLKPCEASKIVRELHAAGLLDPLFSEVNVETASDLGRYSPHNWTQRQPVSDDVAARVQAHRARKQARMDPKPPTPPQGKGGFVTLHETPHIPTSNGLDKSRSEQIQNRTDDAGASATAQDSDEAWQDVGEAINHDRPTRIKPVPKPTQEQSTIDAFQPVLIAYPCRLGVLPDADGGLAAFAAIPAADWPRVVSGTQAFAEHEDAKKDNGRFVPSLPRFLAEGWWKRYQPKPTPDVNAPPPRAAWLVESDARRAAKAARLAAAAAGKELSA